MTSPQAAAAQDDSPLSPTLETAVQYFIPSFTGHMSDTVFPTAAEVQAWRALEEDYRSRLLAVQRSLFPEDERLRELNACARWATDRRKAWRGLENAKAAHAKGLRESSPQPVDIDAVDERHVEQMEATRRRCLQAMVVDSMPPADWWAWEEAEERIRRARWRRLFALGIGDVPTLASIVGDDAVVAGKPPRPPERLPYRGRYEPRVEYLPSRRAGGTHPNFRFLCDQLRHPPALFGRVLRDAAEAETLAWPLPDDASELDRCAAFQRLRGRFIERHGNLAYISFRSREVVLSMTESDRLRFGEMVAEFAERRAPKTTLDRLHDALNYIAGLHDNAFPGLHARFAAAGLFSGWRDVLYREGDMETLEVLRSIADRWADPDADKSGLPPTANVAGHCARELQRAKPELIGPPEDGECEPATPHTRTYYPCGFAIVSTEGPDAKPTPPGPSPLTMFPPPDGDVPNDCDGWLCDIDLTDERMAFLGLRGKRLRVPLSASHTYVFLRLQDNGTPVWMHTEPFSWTDDDDPLFDERQRAEIASEYSKNFGRYAMGRQLATPREPIVGVGLDHHLAGEPEWIQCEDLRDCPGCNEPMRFLLKFIWGMEYYVLICPDCMILASTTQID